LKVLDISRDVDGRFAAKLLAMSGMTVLRPVHRAGPSAPAETPGHLDIYLDAHKQFVPCSSAEEMVSLVAGDDVVFSTFDHGRYVGLASDSVVEALPSTCVHITTSTFGTTGPYASFRGGPLAAWAAGGYLAITGEADREPLIGPENLCGYIGGYTAAIAAEAALHLRRRSGQGQHVDISTMESMLSVHQSTFSRLALGIVRERTGRYTETYPLVVRPCRDGHVSLGVVTDSEFDRFAMAIGRADLITDERYGDKNARWDHRDEFDAEIDAFLSSRDADEVVDILRAHGVAAAKVAGPSDVLSNPQLDHRRFWDHPQGGPPQARMPGNPIPAATRFSDSRRHHDVRSTIPARSDGLPLAGMVVLDFTAFWAGPSATRWLADLGANVIWIERPHSRVDVDPRTSDTLALVMHLFHLKMNRNKQSVVLDLTDPRDQVIAHRLAGMADVLVENSRPGVMDRFGLGPSDLCRSHPSLVYVSLSGFGSTGPWSERRSYGPTIEAASSIEARTGYAGGEPLRLGHTLPDGAAGLAGALGALRGLRERAETGAGGWFDISQLEVYTAMSGEDLLSASISDQPLVRVGNRSRSGATQGVFPCRGADTWVAIRLEDRSELERFAAVAGLPALAQLASASPVDEAAVEGLIGSYTVLHDAGDVTSELQGAGLEAFPVLGPPELVIDHHLNQRSFFVDVPFHGRSLRLPGSPLHSDHRMVRPGGPAPSFGQHTDEVLKTSATTSAGTRR
jgi:crotonobetainyl-CoA:carnitine CoA-transferase CaiB-like acyl-CoA transferase